MKKEELLHLLKSSFPLIKIQLYNEVAKSTERHTKANFLGDSLSWSKLKDRSPIRQTTMELDFTTNEDNLERPNYLCIRNAMPNTFHWNEYLEHLNTDILGRTLIHCDTIPTTFDIIQGHFLKSGLAVVADEQTAGKGRTSNKWLSPKGKK